MTEDRGDRWKGNMLQEKRNQLDFEESLQEGQTSLLVFVLVDDDQ